MKVLTKCACLSVVSLAFTLMLAGCGGPDNEKTMNTGTDGTPTAKGEPPPTNPTSSEDAYKQMQKSQKDVYGGYGKRR